MKKFNMDHKTREEKRRLAFEKRNVKKEQNVARYGAEGGAALVMAKTTDFNRRLLAALLALVFVLTSVVVGYNLSTRAQGTVDEDGYGMMETVDEETGMVLRKGYLYDENTDTYSLKLEAYSTKDTTKKAVKANTPLDIVMVLDQSGTMNTKDVLKGRNFYQASDKSSFTISDIKDGDYYYYDENDNKYYPVEVDNTSEESYVKIKDSNGNEITQWTAQSANTWYNNNPNTDNQDLYYLNNEDPDNPEFETVCVDRHDWYKNAGNLSVDKFIQTPAIPGVSSAFYVTNNSNRKADYYYNSNSNEERPSWHLVYYNSHGFYWGYAGGYDLVLWYYINSETGNTITTDSNLTGYTSQYNNALGQSINRIGSGDYDARYFTFGIGVSNTDYTGGKLYTKVSATSSIPFNYMYTVAKGSSSEARTLAWPLAGNASATSVQSSTFSGNLYAAGYKLYYTDDNDQQHYIGTAVNEHTEPAYIVADNDNVQLYEKETITRLEAMKTAASNFAQQIATASSGNVDNRIAIVGYNDNGSVATNLVSVTADDGDDDNNVNDTIDSAISGLTASGGSSLSAGLTKTATDVFAQNLLDPADSRKRIVIVFGDKETWESNDNGTTRSADAVLKDTYNASVYTVGLFNGAPESTVEQFMRELSSEYFSSAANPTTYKEMSGTYHYLADSYVFPDESDSIYSTFEAVATAVQSPTTEFVLDATTALLKDVIHDNFNLPDNPSGKTTVKVAVAETYTDGEPNWGNPQPDNTITYNWDDKTLSVTGFNYDANYVSSNRPASAGKGEKIIVTISGLTINQRVRTESPSAKRIYFNTNASGIYKDGAEELLVDKFPRPFLDDQTWLAPAGGTGTMNENGIVVNKYLTPNENGNYDLTVEAYTTQTNVDVTEKVPTDFIVVADQSGSMSTQDMPTGYRKMAGTKTLEEIADGDYYVLGDDGNYYRVYGTRNYLWRYYPANYWYVGALVDRFGADLGWFMSETEASTTFENQMYFREVVGGETYYQPITMTVEGKIGTYYIGFNFDSALTGRNYQMDRELTTYSSNGNSPWYRTITGSVWKSGVTWRAANAAVQTLYPSDNAYTFSELLGINTGMYVNYPMYDRHVGYSNLCYRDVNGVEHVLAADNGQKEWEFCNDNGQVLTSQTGSRPTYSGLYEASGYQSRLEALKYALNEFAQTVANEKNSDGTAVDNKIAIVGFSSPSYSTYNNTELLTGESWDVSNNNGVRYDRATNTNYAEALVSATNNSTVGSVNTKVTNAINALTANGGTQPEDGLQMAYNILDKRTSKTYTIQTGVDQGTVIDRNTIVIYFTDGRPGDYTYSNQYQEANEVVAVSEDIKTFSNPEGSHPSVFSIGVFGESDGNPLTYLAYEETRETKAHEYDPGWTETYRYSNASHYYYLNRNWRSGNPDNYGTSADDTIYDYMSVVSSNYPSAGQFMKVKNNNTAGEADITGYSNYHDMVSGVRGTYIGSNDYYRMASNQATLVAAFFQAVTMMNQTISSSDRLDAASVMQDVFNNTSFTVEDGYSIRATTVDGSMDKYGIVTFDENTTAPATGVITNLRTVGGNQTVTVTGFDYLENYINYGTKNIDGDVVIPQHDGKKLVVTISNVVPTVTGDRFYSNISTAHESSMYVNNHSVTNTDFPTPSISRHKYTLDVGDVNKNATFTVAMKILDADGNEVSKDSSMLDDVILVYPNGTRKLYSQVGAQEFLEVRDGQSFYLENVPATYQVKADVTSTDDAYVYTIWFDDDTANEQEMTKGTPVEKTFDYLDDHVIHITSVRGTKQVTIREQTIGSYGNVSQIFDEAVTMEIPVIQGETTQLKYDCTFNDDYCGFENGLPSGATYKAVFEVDTEHSTAEKTVAKLVGIEYTQGGTTNTWPVTNNQLPMRDDDVITFTAVPVGNTFKVQEGDTHEHDVFYYYGQNNVSASGIKLESSNGELLSGTHTFTFAPVDGTETDELTVTFVDGSITKINNDDVTANSAIDFAQYQSMYVINDDVSDAVINLDGTIVSFDAETDGNDTAYVATIKRQMNQPPVSVTVERNDMDILIVNERGDIPIEGIFDYKNHNRIIYILAAVAGIAVAGAGIFLWKKKDEFVEE